jgi:predicted TPR repeat methyltransferase
VDATERIRWLAPLEPVESLDGSENIELRDALQHLTRRVAKSAQSWTDDERREVTHIFDARAPEWVSRSKPAYFLPLIDALDRGGVAASGTCIEIGSGIGLQTPTLLGHFDEVISLDLSLEMIAHSPRITAHLLLADASRLPFPRASASAIV